METLKGSDKLREAYPKVNANFSTLNNEKADKFDLNSHKATAMPHIFHDEDVGKTYRYGLAQKDGHIVFSYEEVS